jgi:hypothetical protein
MNTVSSTDLLPVASERDCISAAHESMWTSSVIGGLQCLQNDSAITEITHVFPFLLIAHNVYGDLLRGKDIITYLKTSDRDAENKDGRIRYLNNTLRVDNAVQSSHGTLTF